MEEQEYIKIRLEDQIEWYDNKSQRNQKYYKTLRVCEMIISALVPILISVGSSNLLIRLIIGLCGTTVTVLIGIQGLYNFHENWIEYRTVAETLKHEKFLYETKSGVYESAENPFKLLVDRTESIISHENINWSQLNKSGNNKSHF